RVQILVGPPRVTQIEMDRFTPAHVSLDSQRPGLAVQAEYIANEKIAALKFSLVLSNDAADVETLLKELLVARAQFLPELLQARQRRLAAELFDDIIVPPGDNHVLADRPATLGDNAAHLDGPL